MADQVKFLQNLKTKGPAGQCKICISCWQLIVVSDAPLTHKEHLLTGTFEQMASATKDSLKGLCTSKNKMRNEKELQVLLFTMSDNFVKLTKHLWPAVPLPALAVARVETP